MINQSFVFLDGVSLSKEKKIWDQDIHSWNDFLGKPCKGISASTKLRHSLQIKQAERAIQDQNYAYFQNYLPQGQQWRLFPLLKDDLIYLDIETSGYYGDITVIGMYDGKDTMTMIRGRNLDKELLRKTLAQYKAIVTFNGSSFDLPVIKKYFHIDFSDKVHIDLRHVCSKIGLTGGLKKIEKDVGIKRADAVSNVTGEDAVYLWQQYKATGNTNYLDLLVQYNEEDIINLEPLAKMAIPQLWKQMKEK